MLFDHPAEIVNFNSDEKNYLDVELMKHCKHNIIANSSFSWWGAWLNENPGKWVVAPAKWFNQGQHPAALIPKTWTVI
jgi:hypothetical protein